MAASLLERERVNEDDGVKAAVGALQSSAVDPRQERSAKNEALFREVNDRIHEVGERLQILPDGELLEFRCECGRPACDEFVPLSTAEYEHVRSDNDRFIVFPGHQDPGIERVVERTERYVVVDKRPQAEPLVGADGEPDSGA
jgi:hypothetical protein